MGFQFLFALYENVQRQPTTAEDVASYANYIGGPDFPIFADSEGVLKDATPMTQETHPEVCALSDELEILDCTTGHGGFETMMDAIRDHAGL